MQLINGTVYKREAKARGLCSVGYRTEITTGTSLTTIVKITITEIPKKKV